MDCMHTKIGISTYIRHQSRHVPGTNRDAEDFYDLWTIAEYQRMLDRQKTFRQALARQKGWGSSVRHLNPPGASGWGRVAQTDEDKTNTSPRGPSPAVSRSNGGASHDDGGRSIFSWINGEPMEPMSARPCPDYSYARGGSTSTS